MEKKGGKKKTDEKVDRLQGANPVSPQGEGRPRGNSRDFFFQRIFGVCSRFSKNKRL